MMHIPEGSFKFRVGEGNFEPILQTFGGVNALSEWKQLNAALRPIQELATAIPPLILRSDYGLLRTMLPHLWKLIKGALVVSKVEGSFKDVSKHYVTDRFLVLYVDEHAMMKDRLLVFCMTMM